jgi:dual specificity protein kinase YAK1
MTGVVPQPGRGPVPKFQKLKSVQELQPRINAQPPFRRANPEGGFISVRSNQSKQPSRL